MTFSYAAALSNKPKTDPTPNEAAAKTTTSDSSRGPKKWPIQQDKTWDKKNKKNASSENVPLAKGAWATKRIKGQRPVILAKPKEDRTDSKPPSKIAKKENVSEQTSSPPKEQKADGGSSAMSWKTVATAPSNSVPSKRKTTKVAPNPGQQTKTPSQAKKSKKPKQRLQSVSLGDMIPNSKKILRKKKESSQTPTVASTDIPAQSLDQQNYTSDFPSLHAGPGPVAKQNTKPKIKSVAKTPSTAISQVATKKSQGQKGQPAPKGKATTQKASSGATKGNNRAAPEQKASVLDFLKPSMNREGQDDDGHQLLRLMQDRSVYQKKGRQRLNPRRKKFSALKKKVLQERLQKWKEHNKDKESSNVDPSLESKDMSTVCVYNYVSAEDTEDDEEYNELLENLSDFGKGVGDVEETYIPRGLDRDGRYPAFVKFKSNKDAKMAKECWEGLVVAGSTLEAKMIHVIVSEGKSWEESVMDAEARDTQESKPSLFEILLKAFLTEDDYEDQDCMDESLQDIRTLASKYGKVVDVKARDGKLGDVLLSYEVRQEEVANIVSSLCQSTISGQPLQALVAEQDSSVANNPDRDVIVVRNALSENDLEDDDCMTETLGDLQELVSKRANVLSIKAVESDVHILLSGTPESINEAAQDLDGLVLGGSILSAFVGTSSNELDGKQFSVYLHNVLTEDDLGDEECLQETLDDTKVLLSKIGAVEDIQVLNIDGSTIVGVRFADDSTMDFENVLSSVNELVVGGVTIKATRTFKSESTVGGADAASGTKRKTVDTDPSSKKTKTDDTQPLYSGDKLIPERFAEAKRAPKIPNAPGPREYAKTTTDERIRPLLIEVLGELMRLQKRAAIEKNTKAKRRLVMGLREVARGIRSRKMRMVVMANNLDEYGAIDEKLQEIIDLAQNAGVPIFYEFTKRSLGKALGKSIKVAVVGIQNADGANQSFKKLLSLASKV